jgi:hypothetical protein
MKRVSIAALVCGMIFGVLSTWLGPKMIAYWYAPPVPAGAASAFNCTDAVNWAMHKLVLTQIIGTLIGLLAGAIIAALVVRRPARSPPASPPPPRTA